MKQENTHRVTFDVETLERPTELLDETTYGDFVRGLINSDYECKFKNDNVFLDEKNIVAECNFENKMVRFGNPFLDGIHRAYAEHRPFVFSPDIIWLLISQGFSHHVKNNSEELKELIVGDSEKKALIVENEKIDIDKKDSPWEEVFPEFARLIRNEVGNELVDALTADFSTTTSTERIVSEITIMKSFEDYFEYVVLNEICGIPEITIEGTVKDWEMIIMKVNSLKKYNLSWWVNDIIPILNEFLEASKNKIDVKFWQEMFKFHYSDGCGDPNIIDGWITKLFPYDASGNRTKYPVILGDIGEEGVSLPDELVKVDFLHVKRNDDLSEISTPLEFWAGFVGLEQCAETYALRPKIGWLIKKRGESVKESFTDLCVGIKVNTFPLELLGEKKIEYLDIAFTNKIDIPQEVDVEFDSLALYGTEH